MSIKIWTNEINYLDIGSINDSRIMSYRTSHERTNPAKNRPYQNHVWSHNQNKSSNVQLPVSLVTN